MSLHDPAWQVLERLGASTGAYLSGTRRGDGPFALIDDNAAVAGVVDSIPLIPRSVVEELLSESCLDSDLNGAQESVRVAYTISANGRRLLAEKST